MGSTPDKILNVIQKDVKIMEKIPPKIHNLYVDFLKTNGYPSEEIPSAVKWLQYYFDFCAKYNHTKSSPESLNMFILKLR